MKSNDNLSYKQNKAYLKAIKRIEKHKDAISLISVALGVIITSAWNIISYMYFKGTTDYYNIDYQYAEVDVNNLLTTFLISLFVSLIFVIPIYLYAEWSICNRCVIKSTIVIVLIQISTFLIAFLISWNLAIIPAFFFTVTYIYYMIVLLNYDKIRKPEKLNEFFKKRRSKRREKHRIDISLEQSCREKKICKRIKWIKRIIKKRRNKRNFAKVKSLLISFLVITIALLLLIGIAYGSGYSTSQNRKEYELIYDNGTTLDLNKLNKVILSETDSVFFIAECTVEEINDSTSSSEKNKKITIYNSIYSIVDKTDIERIIKLKFKTVDYLDPLKENQ